MQTNPAVGQNKNQWNQSGRFDNTIARPCAGILRVLKVDETAASTHALYAELLYNIINLSAINFTRTYRVTWSRNG